MRRRNKGNMFVGYSDRRLTCINANTINVTNVTNVRHVHHEARFVNASPYSSYVGCKPFNKNNKNGRKRHERRERPPKLTKYYASFGLMDRDVAARMNDRQLVDEAAKVTSYAAKGVVHHTGRFFGSAASCVGGLAKSVGMLFGSVFGAFR